VRPIATPGMLRWRQKPCSTANQSPSRDEVVNAISGYLPLNKDTNPYQRVLAASRTRAGLEDRHAGTAQGHFRRRARRQSQGIGKGTQRQGHARSRHRNPPFQRPQTAGMLHLRCCAAPPPHPRASAASTRPKSSGFRGTANNPRAMCRAISTRCSGLITSARTMSRRSRSTRCVQGRAGSWRSLPTRTREEGPRPPPTCIRSDRLRARCTRCSTSRKPQGWRSVVNETSPQHTFTYPDIYDHRSCVGRRRARVSRQLTCARSQRYPDVADSSTRRPRPTVRSRHDTKWTICRLSLDAGAVLFARPAQRS